MSIIVEIRHQLNGGTKLLQLEAQDEDAVHLRWPGVGVLSFDTITGEGTERDCRDWELSKSGRDTLGLGPPRGRGERGRQIDKVNAAARGDLSLDAPKRGKKPHPKQIALFAETKK